MRINKFIALATGMSRRDADKVIAAGNAMVNGQPPSPGHDVQPSDVVMIGSRQLQAPTTQTIIFNKPTGYVVSRDGQGNKTIYDLLPTEMHHLKPVGRLDKDSSGLLLLTNNGQLAQQLTHPSHQKIKIYEVKLNKPLQPLHQQMITDTGLQLTDGLSKLALEKLDDTAKLWRITMHEGRNRQIRRTFSAIGYNVQTLHRTQFGDYKLQPGTQPGTYSTPSV